MRKILPPFFKASLKNLLYGGLLTVGLLGSYLLVDLFYVPSQAIIFLSDRDGGQGIYLMRPDGSGQKRLSSYQPRSPIWYHLKRQLPGWLGKYLPAHVYNHSPRWSPDGTRIVYAARPDNEEEIFTMNANSLNKTRLTHNTGFDSYAVWSPDGAHIAFRSHLNYSEWYLFVMDADGGAVTRLAPSLTVDSLPAWSPDSTQIAFMDHDTLYRINVDGTGLMPLTQARDDPIWSPGGDKIVFVCSSSQSPNFELCSINPDGSGLAQLTSDGTPKFRPVWSPDGRQIAFEAVVAMGNIEIFVMESHGANVVRLTHNMAYDGHMTWSPDSTRIAYTSNQDGNLEIYAMDIDGANLVRLTDNPAADYDPMWRP